VRRGRSQTRFRHNSRQETVRKRFFASLIALFLVMSAAGAYQDAPEYGPAKAR